MDTSRPAVFARPGPKPEIVELDWAAAPVVWRCLGLDLNPPDGDVGREQGMPGFELRGVVSLVRLLGERGRAKQARDLLAPGCRFLPESSTLPTS